MQGIDDEFFSRGKRRKTPKHKQRHPDPELEKKIKGNLELERIRERERGRNRSRLRPNDFFRDRDNEPKEGRIEMPERIPESGIRAPSTEKKNLANQELLLNFEKTLPSPTVEALNRFRDLSQHQIRNLKQEGFDSTESISKILGHIRGDMNYQSPISSSDLNKVMMLTGVSEKEATSALVLKEEVQKMRGQGKNTTQMVEELVERLAGMPQLNTKQEDKFQGRKRDLSLWDSHQDLPKRIKMSPDDWNNFYRGQSVEISDSILSCFHDSPSSFPSSQSHLSLPPLQLSRKPHSLKAGSSFYPTPSSFSSETDRICAKNTERNPESLKRLLEGPRLESDASKRLRLGETSLSSPPDIPEYPHTTTTTTTTPSTQ